MSNDKSNLNQNKSCKLIDSFEPGDFLFGLEDGVRDIYYNDLKEKLKQVGAKYHFVTIDDLVKPLEPYYIYDDHPSMSPLDAQSTPVKNHARLLLSTQAFAEISCKISSPSKQEKNKLLMSCLLALEHHRGKIHFCIDRLDLNKVRSKAPENRQYYEGFTSQELRYIATHYQEVRSKVLFYFRGQRVESPWEAQGQSPAEWLATDIEVERVVNLSNPRLRLAPHRLNFIDEMDDKANEEHDEAEPLQKSLKLETNDEDIGTNKSTMNS